jgi:hypothetical protein
LIAGQGARCQYAAILFVGSVFLILLDLASEFSSPSWSIFPAVPFHFRQPLQRTRSPDASKSRTSVCSICTSSRGYSLLGPAMAPNRRNKRRSIRYRPSAGSLEETLITTFSG